MRSRDNLGYLEVVDEALDFARSGLEEVGLANARLPGVMEKSPMSPVSVVLRSIDCIREGLLHESDLSW